MIFSLFPFLSFTKAASVTPCINPPVAKFAIILALLVALSFSCKQSSAQTNNDDIAPVVIIGSRFPSSPDLAPIGAVVITASDIHRAGINNVNEAIRKLAGVYGRQSFYGTQDFDLDLSGFGADSANNIVIMVDGVRLSENEQAAALLSSIPIESVARIEIMRGGSSVLYGDGATGGVIQIVTKQTGQTPLTGSVSAEVGQFNERAGKISLSQGWDKLNVSLNLSDQKTDNYRINNTVSQQNISGDLTWYFAQGRIGLRTDSVRQKVGLPGALATLAQFEQDPRQSLNPFDNASISMDRYTAFIEQNIDHWQATAELSNRERTTKANFVSLQSMSIYSGHQTQFSPRLRHTNDINGLHNEFVAGLDFINWNRQTKSNYSLDYATQKSKAIYFRNEANVGQARLAFGARREIFDKTSANPFAYSADNYNVVQAVNAWELQGSYAFTPAVNTFAKIGQSYRVANVDDNSFTAEPNTPLLPQHSHDIELGTVLGKENQQLTLRLFRHNIIHEIYYSPTANSGLGANSNLDPTKRQGVALDAKWRLSKQFRLTAQAQHVNAVFTAGVNEGKKLALVPKNTVSAYVNWVVDEVQNAFVGVQWVDTQRYGGDFTNACPVLIPAHVSLDARYSQTVGAWELAVMGSNLTNKKYFTNAYGCMSGIYPDAGRQLKVSLIYSF